MDRRKISPNSKGFLIGRGALRNPWIFQEIKQQKPVTIHSIEIILYALGVYSLLHESYGNDYTLLLSLIENGYFEKKPGLDPFSWKELYQSLITNMFSYKEDIDEFQIEPLSVLKKLKFAKNWPQEDLLEYANQPYIKSLLLLKENKVGGVVCGSELSSADVIRGALRIIGLKNSVKNLSSMFLMVSQNGKNFFTFSDCAVIPEPSPEQLAEIAYQSSLMHESILNESPKIAFLSFSTKIPHLFFSKLFQGVLFDNTIGFPHDNASTIAIPKLSNSDAKVK